MTIILLFFMLLAALGFVLSVVVHVMSILGQAPIDQSWFMALHMGIFVVWLPAVLVSRESGQQVDNKRDSRKDAWKRMLAGCPVWMRYALYALFAYAMANFLFFFLSTVGQPHGGASGGLPVRGFSGHWMVFYAAAFCMLYAARRRRNGFG